MTERESERVTERERKIGKQKDREELKERISLYKIGLFITCNDRHVSLGEVTTLPDFIRLDVQLQWIPILETAFSLALRHSA